MRKALFVLVIVGVLLFGKNVYAAGDEQYDPIKVANALEQAFVQVAEKVKPCVVRIDTEKLVKYRYWDPFNLFEEGPFRGFPFDQFFGKPQMRESTRLVRSLGSGFIISKDGYILTNNHVIKDVDQIYVKLAGSDNKYKAEVVGVDAATDIALIKIEPDKDLPVVKLGDSDKLRVGEWVLAIGNPFGLEQTVTVGIVSAKGRHNFKIMQYEDFIQTDASINPGNSGGPLVNLRGEVVGINTFIIQPYMAQNTGFAIPINIAKAELPQLKNKGFVERGWLGVMIGEVTSDVAEALGLEEGEGAIITEVLDDSPAQKAGLKPFDVVVEFNGQKVEGVRDLQMKVGNTKPGTKITLGIIREGKKMNIKVTVGKMPAEITGAPVGREIKSKLGVEVSDITDEIAKELGLKDRKGAVVTGVEPGSPADRAGMKEGDVIFRINWRKRVVLLGIRREGRVMYLVVRVPEE